MPCTTYVGMNINYVSLYVIKFKLNNFAVTLHILLHVIMCVKEILSNKCKSRNVVIIIYNLKL